jgi:hypothetical protein
MTGLFPSAIRDAVEHRGNWHASQSYGVVLLAVLLVLLCELQALSLTRTSPDRRTILAALVAPLLIVFVAVTATRLADLFT